MAARSVRRPMTAAVMACATRRWGLDALVARMTEPGFVTLYCRARSFRETNGHVSPSILSVQSPRAGYVSRWRRHARRCPTCGSVFRYFGFSL
jgi:hypothetical protein